MATFSSLHFHFVFSTKNRVPSLKPQWQPQLVSYMKGTITGLDGVPEAINGIEDHIHMLVGLSPSHRIMDFIRDVKRSSSIWIHEQQGVERFHWQDGYSVFSISTVDCERVKKYIANQVRHHHSQAYIDELKSMLDRAQIPYDPKYLD